MKLKRDKPAVRTIVTIYFCGGDNSTMIEKVMCRENTFVIDMKAHLLVLPEELIECVC